MTLGPNSYRDQVLAAIPANWLDPLLTGPNAALKGLPWECPEIEALLRGLKERIEAIPCGPSLPHPDTARMDFMEGFIVEGSHLSSGKTAWLADVECLRECIDEGMRVVQERRDATGTP